MEFARMVERKFRWFLLIVITVIGTTGLPYWLPLLLPVEAYSWSSSVVDQSGTEVGESASIAYDSNGNPGIAYSAKDGDNYYYLRYAYYNGASWSTENVKRITTTAKATHASLIFYNDIPKVVYYHRGGFDLGFARRGASGTTTLNPDNGAGESDCNDTDWNCSLIDSTNTVGEYASMALDSLGNLGVAYHYGTGGDLRYAYHNGSSWSTEDVYTTGTVGRFSAVTFVGTTAYIAFEQTTDTDLIVAARNGGGSGNCDDGGANNNEWNCEIVDNNMGAGTVSTRTIDTAVDTFGNVGVSYFSGGSLKYALRVGGGMGGMCTDNDWICALVDTSGGMYHYSSLLFSSDGIAQVAYYDSTNGDLEFADNNGPWSLGTVDSANSVGQWNSIARTGSTTGIAYYDGTNGDLLYATATISYNSAPVATTPTGVTQSTDASGYLTFSTTISDADSDNTKLKVEYSDNGGSNWYDPYLISATPSSGSVDLNNGNVFQIGTSDAIDTSGGAITLTIVWDTQSASNENGSLDGTDQSDIQVRVTPNDSTVSGLPQAVASFEVDNLDPGTPGNLLNGGITTTSLTLTFGAQSSDTNFDRYKIFYIPRTGGMGPPLTPLSGIEHSDADLLSVNYGGTSNTTIAGLDVNTQYEIGIWAYDLYGNNTSNVANISIYTAANAPSAPTITNVSTTAFDVDITAGDGNPAITEYAIQETGSNNYVQSDGSLGVSAFWANAVAWDTINVIGLTSNTQYTFKAKARNADSVETAFGATSSKYTHAAAVSAFAVAETTDKSGYKVNLTWTNPTPTPSGLYITRDTDCNGSFETTVYNNTSVMPTSPHSVASLAANTCYVFKATSYNGDGTLNSGDAVITANETLGPAQPTGLAHTANTDSSITWDWADVSGATDYNVYNNADDSLIGAVGGATSSYVQSAGANVGYTVYVRAVNANGEGIASSTASAYSSANVPISLSHSTQTETGIRWVWVSGGAESGFWARSTNPVDAVADWITDLFWAQTGLTQNNPTNLFVKAKNGDGDQTSESSITRYTSIAAPTGVTFSGVGTDTITVTADGTFANLTSGSSGIYFSNGLSSLWQQSVGWINGSLSPNTQYTYTLKARNGDGDETSTVSDSKYTLANVPGAPTAQAPAVDSMTVVIDVNSNPALTTFAIQNVGAGNYVQADGTLGVSAVWQTYATWGGASGIEVTGLSVGTSYQFKVKAKNGDDVETALSSASTAVYTLANVPSAPTVSATSATSETVVINVNSNPSGTTFAIQNVAAGNYVQADGTLGASAVWQTYATWGGASGIEVTGLSVNISYQFKAKAKNGSNVETALSVASTAVYTLANVPSSLTATSVSLNSITLSWSANSNPAGTNYYVTNTTSGVFSGWLTDIAYTFSSLSPGSSYTFNVKAKNGDGTLTAAGADYTTKTNNNPAPPAGGGAPPAPPETPAPEPEPEPEIPETEDQVPPPEEPEDVPETEIPVEEPVVPEKEPKKPVEPQVPEAQESAAEEPPAEPVQDEPITEPSAEPMEDFVPTEEAAAEEAEDGPSAAEVFADAAAEIFADAAAGAKTALDKTTTKIAEVVYPAAKNSIKIFSSLVSRPDNKVKKQMSDIKTIVLDNLIVQKVNEVATVPVLAATSATATITLVSIIGNVSTYFQFLVTQPVVLWYRRRKKEWGVVYDSITKRPIDLAVIRVFDAKTNRLLQTRVTDRNGRYHFVLESGDYYVVVQKQEYAFPSALLREASADEKYTDLYYGKPVKITEKRSLTMNIPVDPDKKMVSNRRALFAHFMRRAQYLLLFTGPVFAAISLIVKPQPWVLAVMVAHLIGLGLYLRIMLPPALKDWGAIKVMNTDKPLKRAVTRIFDSRFNKLLDIQVTDSKGRYSFLAGNNIYYVTAEKEGFVPRKSDFIDLRRNEDGGFVNLDMYLKRQRGEKIQLAQSEIDKSRMLEREAATLNKDKKVSGVKIGDLHEDIRDIDYIK